MIPKQPAPLFLQLGSILARAQIQHALIGGHAVNAWVEPRFTADIDVTIQADPAASERLGAAFHAEGFAKTTEHGAQLPSGPDFARYRSRDGRVTIEVQGAKTAFQHELIRRARSLGAGLRVATPEDLVVLKLIADRPKDQVDLASLSMLPNLDWTYIEHWAKAWGVQARLARLRQRP
jgi:hypothetical protein